MQERTSSAHMTQEHARNRELLSPTYRATGGVHCRRRRGPGLSSVARRPPMPPSPPPTPPPPPPSAAPVPAACATRPPPRRRTRRARGDHPVGSPGRRDPPRAGGTAGQPPRAGRPHQDGAPGVWLGCQHEHALHIGAAGSAGRSRGPRTRPARPSAQTRRRDAVRQGRWRAGPRDAHSGAARAGCVGLLRQGSPFRNLAANWPPWALPRRRQTRRPHGFLPYDHSIEADRDEELLERLEREKRVGRVQL